MVQAASRRCDRRRGSGRVTSSVFPTEAADRSAIYAGYGRLGLESSSTWRVRVRDRDALRFQVPLESDFSSYVAVFRAERQVANFIKSAKPAMRKPVAAKHKILVAPSAFNVDGKFCAINDMCSHHGGPWPKASWTEPP
jgi:hypothetical protein